MWMCLCLYRINKTLTGACTVALLPIFIVRSCWNIVIICKNTFYEFFIPELFLKFGIVFEKNTFFCFFRVIFKLSYQTNILINFLVSSMYTKRNYWGIKYIEYIFYFCFSTPGNAKFIFFCSLPFFCLFFL